jgi:hypothetical protein
MNIVLISSKAFLAQKWSFHHYHELNVKHFFVFIRFVSLGSETGFVTDQKFPAPTGSGSQTLGAI